MAGAGRSRTGGQAIRNHLAHRHWARAQFVLGPCCFFAVGNDSRRDPAVAVGSMTGRKPVCTSPTDSVPVKPKSMSTDVHACPLRHARKAHKIAVFRVFLNILKKDLRKKGLEPLRPFGHQLLRLARLPLPPLPHRRCSDYNKSEIVTPTLTIDLLLGCWQSHPMKLKRMEDAARINVFFLAA